MKRGGGILWKFGAKIMNCGKAVLCRLKKHGVDFLFREFSPVFPLLLLWLRGNLTAVIINKIISPPPFFCP